jgi:hypothetical protein
MREYRVELGTARGGEKYVRQMEEPILARTDDEAILVASEIIRRRQDDITTAILFSEKMLIVKSWYLSTVH